MNDDNIAPGTPDNVDVVEHEDNRSWQEVAGLDGNTAFEKFDSVNSLAKSYTELEKYNATSMRIPSADASAEAREEFLGKLNDVDGVMRTPEGYITPPDEATAYQFSEVEGFEGGSQIGELKAAAHALGMTNAQADGIHTFLAKNIVENTSADVAAQNTGIAELQGLWGNAFEQKMTGIENTINVLDAKVPGLKESARTPEFVKLMDIVGDMLGEAGAVQNDPRVTMTPDEASRRLSELNDKYSDVQEGDVGYDVFAQRRLELYKQGGRLMRDTRQDY